MVAYGSSDDESNVEEQVEEQAEERVEERVEEVKVCAVYAKHAS